MTTGPAIDGETGPSPADRLLDLLAGKERVAALSAVAALGIPDRLARGPRTVGELALEMGCDERTLESLLRLVTGLGVLACYEPGHYSLTPLGEQLRVDALGPLAAFVGAPEQWDPWSRLSDAMRCTRPATPFAATFGEDLYSYLAHRPEAAARYDHAIDAFTRHEARLLADLGERSGLENARSIVDVGGGCGSLLFELLRHVPGSRGTLYDRPHVVARARGRVPPDCAGRVEFVAGDFHSSVPGGHDRIVLKHVLHNWDDERAGRLLGRCARALGSGGRVLVVEALLSATPRADMAHLLDLEMRVLTGGFVRRKPDLRRLFRRAGLVLERVEPLGQSWLLVGAPRPA